MTETRVITTRTGTAVRSTLTDGEAMEQLLNLVETHELRADFPCDLARKLKADKGLSQEQIKWCHVLVIKHTDATESQPAYDTINIPLVATMLMNASEHLKCPKITFTGIVVKKMHPAANRNRGGKFWFWGPDRGQDWGQLKQDGAWNPPRTCPREVVDQVIAFNADPTGVAKLHGTTTGFCCFCARELTTAESVSVGYGPICAGRYGLPWGPNIAVTQVERARRLAANIEAEKLLQTGE